MTRDTVLKLLRSTFRNGTPPPTPVPSVPSSPPILSPSAAPVALYEDIRLALPNSYLATDVLDRRLPSSLLMQIDKLFTERGILTFGPYDGVLGLKDHLESSIITITTRHVVLTLPKTAADMRTLESAFLKARDASSDDAADLGDPRISFAFQWELTFDPESARTRPQFSVLRALSRLRDGTWFGDLSRVTKALSDAVSERVMASLPIREQERSAYAQLHALRRDAEKNRSESFFTSLRDVFDVVMTMSVARGGAFEATYKSVMNDYLDRIRRAWTVRRILMLGQRCSLGGSNQVKDCAAFNVANKEEKDCNKYWQDVDGRKVMCTSGYDPNMCQLSDSVCDATGKVQYNTTDGSGRDVTVRTTQWMPEQMSQSAAYLRKFVIALASKDVFRALTVLLDAKDHLIPIDRLLVDFNSLSELFRSIGYYANRATDADILALKMRKSQNPDAKIADRGGVRLLSDRAVETLSIGGSVYAIRRWIEGIPPELYADIINMGRRLEEDPISLTNEVSREFAKEYIGYEYVQKFRTIANIMTGSASRIPVSDLRKVLIREQYENAFGKPPDESTDIDEMILALDTREQYVSAFGPPGKPMSVGDMTAALNERSQAPAELPPSEDTEKHAEDVPNAVVNEQPVPVQTTAAYDPDARIRELKERYQRDMAAITQKLEDDLARIAKEHEGQRELNQALQTPIRYDDDDDL